MVEPMTNKLLAVIKDMITEREDLMQLYVLVKNDRDNLLKEVKKLRESNNVEEEANVD